MNQTKEVNVQMYIFLDGGVLTWRLDSDVSRCTIPPLVNKEAAVKFTVYNYFFHSSCVQDRQLVHILSPSDGGDGESSCVRRSPSSAGDQMANLKVVAPPSYLHALFKAHLSQGKSACSHIKHPLARLFMPYLCLQNTGQDSILVQLETFI